MEVSSITKIENKFHLMPTEEGVINALPPEIFELFLFSLDFPSLQSAAAVGHLWKERSEGAFKRFSHFLGKNLCNEHCQKEKLLNIGIKIFDPALTKRIKSSVMANPSINAMRADLLNTLKELSEEDLAHLQLVSTETTPKFFENGFELARLYKKIDEACLLSNSEEKKHALLNLSRNLIQMRDINKAISVANLIPGSSSMHGFDAKSTALWHIFNDLLKSDNLEKAIKIAEQISNPLTRASAFGNIAFSLEKNNFFEKAAEFADKAIGSAHQIPDPTASACCLWEIFNLLVQSHNMDKAIEAANQNPDLIKKASAFATIACAFGMNGENEKFDDYANQASDVASQIRDSAKKIAAYCSICMILVNSGKSDKAFDIAQQIAETAIKEPVLRKISKMQPS